MKNTSVSLYEKALYIHSRTVCYRVGINMVMKHIMSDTKMSFPEASMIHWKIKVRIGMEDDVSEKTQE
jgi:hypothetical protein